MEAILRHKGRDPWSGAYGKYKSCSDYISSYYTRSGARYTGLTEEEEKHLEQAIGYPEGHLSKMSDFWKTYSIKLGEKDLYLNTENPLQELMYKFLKGHKRVAVGINAINPSKDWVLIDMEEEAREMNVINKRRREAIKEFDKMSLEEMRKALRVFGIKSDNISSELVESKLYDIVEKQPDTFFMRWVNNKQKDTEFLIEEAISKNIIRRSRNVYYYGTEVIGNSLDDTIVNLNAPKNQDLKIAILEEIKSKN